MEKWSLFLIRSSPCDELTMKKIKLLVEFEYDDKTIHGEEQEAKDWFFNEILKKDELTLNSHEIGDNIGTVKVKKIL